MDSQFRVSRILLHGTLHVYMCGCDVSAINHNILIYMHEIKLYIYIYIHGPFAGTEVTSYRAAIRTARGVVEDIGENAASSSGGLVELSKVSEYHSERDGQNIIANKFKLAIPVDIVDLPKTNGMRYTGNFSVISLKSWAQYIVNMGCWNMLVGLLNSDPKREQDLLRTFWSRYKKIVSKSSNF